MADAGKIVITPKGKYSSTATYEWLDEVTYDGKAYVALKTVTGITPSDDGVNWRLYLDPNDIIAGDLVPTFTEAIERSNIVSDESLSTILGKVKKWFTDLKGHAFNDTVNNLTTSTTGSALDASQGKVLQGEVDEINSNLEVLSYGENAGGINLLDIKNIGISNDTWNLKLDFVLKAGHTYFIKIFSDTSYLVSLVGIGTISNDNYKITTPTQDTQIILGNDNVSLVGKENEFRQMQFMVCESDVAIDTYEPYIPSVKMLSEDVDSIKDALGGLKFSVADGTLSITDGTKTWTLS